MLRLAQPEYLWLLLVIPVVVFAFILGNIQRKRLARRFGNPAILAQLMPDVSRRRPWVKLTLICLALVLFTIGMARPQAGVKEKEVERKGIEIIIALDISNSMLAEDFKPNRIERAKQAITRLVDRMRDDRIGLIVFAGDAYVQLPVTSDYLSARAILSSITPGFISKQGTAMGKAISLALQSFSTEESGGKRSQALIIISDGENHEDDPIAMAKQAAGRGIKVYTIGIGSTKGEPIPYEGGMLKDRNGDVVITRLDERTLVETANAGNGFYTRATDSDLGLTKLVDELKSMEKQELTSVVYQDYDELFMYFFAAAALLLLLEPLLLNRKNRWLSSIDIFRLKDRKT